MVITVFGLNPSYICVFITDFDVLEEVIIVLYLPTTLLHSTHFCEEDALAFAKKQLLQW